MSEPAAEPAPAEAASGRRVLVLNAGSSTLKASILDAGRLGAVDPAPPLAAVTVRWGDDASRGAAVDEGVAAALDALRARGAEPGDCRAVAHRVVHGGEGLVEPARIDEAVLAEVERLAPLAPLHNPVAAATARVARRALPHALHVAVFDTAFHATLPEPARRYPLPAEWDGWGIRRFGFHGLSVAWAVERTAALLHGSADGLGVVVAHLGSGCSVTAVLGGRSVATSMGLTPLEGLMMGTRAGSVDPGILLAVLRDGRRTAADLAEDLDHRAGLLGVSGTTASMQELLAAEAHGDTRAGLAIEMFVERAAGGIGAAATALPRLDALAFTGGIGEHAGRIRQRIVARLGVLGLGPVDAGEDGRDRVLAPARDGGTTVAGPVTVRVEAREDIVAGRAALALAPRAS